MDSAGWLATNWGEVRWTGAFIFFINRQRDHIKLLCWEPGGLVMYQKRLERGRFSVPDLRSSSGVLNWPELVLIVEGIELSSVKKKVRFSDIKKD
jgi:transposase